MNLEMKTNTKISYISAYVKEKFPMYHRAMTELDFGRFVNQIHSSSAIRSVSLEQMKNGDVDNIIDNFVDKYAKENLTDIWENFDKLCQHVTDIITKNSKFKDSPDFLREISLKVSLNVSDQIGYHTIFVNQYDTEIFNNYLSLRNSVKNHFINYIESVFSSLDEKIGFDVRTTKEIYNIISEKMIENYNKDNIYDVSRIRELFVHISGDITRRVIARVRHVLNKVDLLFLYDVSERELFSEVLSMATIRGEISAIKIINGEMDTFIMGIIKSKQKRITKYDRQTVLNYIYNLLLNEGEEEITNSMLTEFSVEVYDRLRSSEYSFSSSDIMEHKCDKIIIDLYMEMYHRTPEIIREKMKRQSVNNKKKNNKKPVDLLKRANLKKRIQKELSCLLIAATLGSVGGFTASYGINKKNDNDALLLAMSLDRTSYSISHSNSTLENLAYDEAATGVTNYYNQLKQYGDEYIYLCFYNAYSDGLSLNEMDHLLGAVRKNVRDDRSYSDLSLILNKEDVFLDFIYDSLLRMGCDEILDDKYIESIISYKQSYYGNIYGIVSDYHMYADDRHNIDRMRELYEEYSKKYLVELGHELEKSNTYNENESFADGNTGRKM